MTAEGVLAADALVRAVPLILTGLAVGLSFRAGVFNLGAEGQLLVGATASALVSIKLSGSAGFLVLPIALTTGAVAGALWAAVAAELKRRFHVLEIISTIMLNFIAIHLVSFLVRGPMQEPTRIYPQTVALAESARLPIVLANTRLHAGFIVALAIAFALAWIMKQTEVGFRIRAIGASPMAAESAAMIDVSRMSWAVLCCSGAIAGLAGAIEVSGVTFALYENISPGYGYTAIAVALIAGLSPLGIVASGIFFGVLETGAAALQRDFAIPSSIAGMIEASLILSTLVFAAMRKHYTLFARREKTA
ncbi:MAG: ABC transporter permease [Gemmatimonadaceae bacterium]